MFSLSQLCRPMSGSERPDSAFRHSEDEIRLTATIDPIQKLQPQPLEETQNVAGPALVPVVVDGLGWQEASYLEFLQPTVHGLVRSKILNNEEV